MVSIVETSSVCELLEALTITDVPVALATCELPAQWPGIHKFEVAVDMCGEDKKAYVVSSKVNKLYVDTDRVVPFQVRWDGTPQLSLRALMVYTQASHETEPVLRCPTHRQQQNDKHSDHVLATDNNNAQYQMDPTSQRHSVLVPLHKRLGSELVNYKFMCRSSCTGGINRRLTDVIFMLEDASGVVLGRQNIGVKICSCPKRDKDNDEVKAYDEGKDNNQSKEGDSLKKKKREKDENKEGKEGDSLKKKKKKKKDENKEGKEGDSLKNRKRKIDESNEDKERDSLMKKKKRQEDKNNKGKEGDSLKKKKGKKDENNEGKEGDSLMNRKRKIDESNEDKERDSSMKKKRKKDENNEGTGGDSSKKIKKDENDEGGEGDSSNKIEKDETAKSSIEKDMQDVDPLRTHSQVSFTVTADTPEAAQAIKDYLKMLSKVIVE